MTTYPALPIADAGNMAVLEACAPYYGLDPHDEAIREDLVGTVEALSRHVHASLTELADTHGITEQ